jgi:hypothetical protein
MSPRWWALCAFVSLAGCATTPEPVATSSALTAQEDDEEEAKPLVAPKAKPAPEPAEAPERSERPPPAVVAASDDAVPKRTSADPFGDVGFHEVNVKEWLAKLRQTISDQEKVPPTDVVMSPGLLRAAYVRSPEVAPPKPGRKPTPRRHELVVVDNQGRRVASFRAVAAKVGDEPPKDLRFLSDDKLVYEVVAPPPEPEDAPKPKPKGKPKKPAARAKLAKAALAAAHPAPPPPPTRLFIIQPIAPKSRPVRCEGVSFAFTKEKDRLAFVAGPPESAFVAVDGQPIYPRRGRTVISSPPAWSKDGHSLAFLETPAGAPPRLVLVAALDNPTGDTTWSLPPTAAIEGVSVFFASNGRLVVGKTTMRPVFSASFDVVK